MRVPGPFSDETWDFLPQGRRAAPPRPSRRNANAFPRVLWELGLVLLVPLAGAGAVEMVLHATHAF